MTIQDVICGLLEQADEKDRPAGGGPYSGYTHEANVLMEAARLLKKQYGETWIAYSKKLEA